MSDPVRPNLLLVLADQWRGCDQGWRGNRDVRTPHLDALARDGIALEGAYANTPVCGPSRASLLTAQLAQRHQVIANDLPLAAALPTLGDVLRGEGYRTGCIGKWHLDGLPRDAWVAPERRRGFDYWAANNCSHDYFDAHYYEGETPQRVDFSGYEPEVQTELAEQFIRADERPFFLVVSYGPPHDPYADVPERFLPPAESHLAVRPNTADDAAAQALHRQYYGGIAAVDAQLGRLHEVLASAGLLEDTLVVVTSDHGDMLGAHGRRAKQVPFEEAVNVPLVLSWPGHLLPSTPVEGLIGLVDLPQTLLGLAGAPPLPETYGLDLSEVLLRGGRLREEVLLGNVVSFDEGHRQGVPEWRGWRDRRHTYARRADGSPWLLYDNERDPFQLENLVDGGHEPAVRQADDRLTELLAQADDPFGDGPAAIRRLGLVQAWNARERELHGGQARLLEPTPPGRTETAGAEA